MLETENSYVNYSLVSRLHCSPLGGRHKHIVPPASKGKRKKKEQEEDKKIERRIQ
jgi:hypothetical protein